MFPGTCSRNTKGAIKAPSKRIVGCPGEIISDRNGLLRIELLVKPAKLRVAEESDASALFRIWETYVRVRTRCLGRGEGFAVPEQLSQIPPVNTAQSDSESALLDSNATGS